MRLVVTLLIILVSALQSVADPYLLFNEKGKIGLKDEAGKVVIPASFEALGWSDGSFSLVGEVTGYKLKDHWGLINLKKEFLSQAIYERLTYPGGDRIIAQKKINAVKTSVGCLNLQGETVIPFAYDGIKIVGLRAIVFVKQGINYTYGLIDLNGHEIIPLHYKNIYPLGTLRYAVENNEKKMALFSEAGTPVTDFKIDSISSFRNNLAIVHQELLQGLINRDGEVRIAPQYSDIRIDADGTVSARLPNEWKVLTGDNREIRKTEGDELIALKKELYCIVKSSRYGILDKNFGIVIPLDYTYLGPLLNNSLVAARNGKFGIVRTNGSILIPLKFDSVIAAGRSVLVREDLWRKPSWSLYDTFGIKKSKNFYDFIGRPVAKLFPVRSHGYWGVMDQFGEEIVHCVFDSLLEISSEQVAVRFRGQFGIISTTENWLLAPQNDRVELVSADRYLIVSGKTVFLKDFEGSIVYFSDNKIERKDGWLLETLADGTDKRIDYDGRIMEKIIPLVPAEKIYSESESLRGIKKDGKYGFVDARGRLRIANRYDGIGLFKEGLAAVKIISKWGYIDTNEKIVVQPAYDAAGEFQNGKAVVRRAGKSGLINTEGKLLLAERYDSIARLADEKFLIVSGNLQGLANKNGQLLINAKYDGLEALNNGYVIIRRDGHFGLLTLEGLSTVPLQYDKLIYDRDQNQFLALMRSGWKKLVLDK
jgi:WG containing repeat